VLVECTNGTRQRYVELMGGFAKLPWGKAREKRGDVASLVAKTACKRSVVCRNSREICSVNRGVYQTFLWAKLEGCGVVHFILWQQPDNNFSRQGNRNRSRVSTNWRDQTPPQALLSNSVPCFVVHARMGTDGLLGNHSAELYPSTVLSRQIRYLRPGIIAPVAVLAGPCMSDHRGQDNVTLNITQQVLN